MKRGRMPVSLRIMGAVLLSSLFMACGHEANSDIEQIIPDNPEDNSATITLVLPSRAFNESSNILDASKEGEMSNLYLAAVLYSSDGNNGDVTWIPLTPSMYVGKDNDYDVYKVKLAPGSYKFYTFANFDSYQSSSNWYESVNTEEKINNLSLDFSLTDAIVPPYLPMACLAKDMQYSIGTDGSKTHVRPEDQYVITIAKDQEMRIYADMTYLCSKVRYTILFNNMDKGFSSEFGNYSIMFNIADHLPYASKVRKKTYLVAEHALSTEDRNNLFIDDKTLDLGWYTWSSTEGEYYPKGPASEVAEWVGTEENWKASRQRVWQGVVYLPENVTSGIDKTVLNFPYKIDLYSDNYDNENYKDIEYSNKVKSMTLFENGDESHYGETNGNYNTGTLGSPSSGLKRGYFYDLVAKVKTPDELDLKFEFYFQVVEWHYVDENVSEDSSLAKIPKGIYIRGTFNDWYCRPDYEMIETTDGQWRSKERISIPNNSQFKIASYNWKDTNIGSVSGYSLYDPDYTCYLQEGSASNIVVTFGYTYYGYVYLQKKTSNDTNWHPNADYIVWVN